MRLQIFVFLQQFLNFYTTNNNTFRFRSSGRNLNAPSVRYGYIHEILFVLFVVEQIEGFSLNENGHVAMLVM